ncbi:unnamed protein product [Boreogadus saida]
MRMREVEIQCFKHRLWRQPTLLSKLCKTKSDRAMDVFSDIRDKKSDIIKPGYELFKIIFRGNPSEDLED